MDKKYIGCRECDSPSCEGCNIYILDTMLRKGKFDSIMYERTVNPYADIVEVVRCGECVHAKERDKVTDTVICTRHMAYKSLNGFCDAGEKSIDSFSS